MPVPVLAVIVAVVACEPDTGRRERDSAAALTALTAIQAESAMAASATAIPATGKWDAPRLVDRLVRSGLAPQALPAEQGASFWGVPVVAWQLGSATLHVYLYADSTARRRVTDGIDPLHLAPKGAASPYPFPRLLIVQNNLAAVLLGASERQQERVSLALAAGLPTSTERRQN